MTESETAKSDRVIREEILRLTLVGLEEDLDDLRDELSRQLESYEGRLKKASSSLPKWLDLGTGRILDAFAISRQKLPDSRLGPRLVASCAARAEAFIDEWIGRDGAIREDQDLKGRPWASDLEDVRNVIEAAESAARDAALNADAELTSLLDLILAELDEKREEDASALRQLVGTGDVERGERARKEIADLWEEQRSRAAELRLIWDTLENLVFEGVDLSIEGLSELDELLNRAEEGLEGADSETLVDDASSDTIPAPMYTKAEGDSKPGHAIDDASRQTEPLDVQGDVGHTNPYLRRPRRSQKRDIGGETLETDRIDDVEDPEVADTPDQGDGAIMDSAPEEPESTDSGDVLGEPVDHDSGDEDDESSSDENSSAVADVPSVSGGDDSDVLEAEVEESGVEDSFEEPLDEELPGEARDEEKEPSEVEGAHPQGVTEKIEFESSEGGHIEEESAEEPVPVSASSEVEETSRKRKTVEARDEEPRDEKPVAGEAFRVVFRWVPVQWQEFALGFGIPIGILVLLAIPGIAELNPDVDPFIQLPWFWVFPWLFIGCVAWSLIFMILRTWRPMWRGWRMHLVRWSEHREHVEVVVDDRGVRFGSVRHAWSQLRAVERRWESKADGTFGWFVRFETRAGETAVAAADRNYTRWRLADAEIEPVPDDVWQVNSNLLSLVRSRIP